MDLVSGLVDRTGLYLLAVLAVAGGIRNYEQFRVEIAKVFGVDPPHRQPIKDRLAYMIAGGLVEKSDRMWRITDRGFDVLRVLIEKLAGDDIEKIRKKLARALYGRS